MAARHEAGRINKNKSAEHLGGSDVDYQIDDADNQVPSDSLDLPISREPREIADHQPTGTPLSKHGARTLTDQIRCDATLVYVQLLRAYEGNAHGALGYSSWGEYCEAELSIAPRRAYRLLDTARVYEVVSVSHGTLHVPAPPNERVARELAPLLDNPNELRETYVEATELASRESHKPPTALQVRTVVEQRRTVRPTARAAPPTPAKPKPTLGLNEAVSALKRAVSNDRQSAPSALATLREIAAGGLYGPQTKDPAAAFRALIEIVALLLEVSL